MDHNNIITAPEIPKGTADAIFDLWYQRFRGSRSQFYSFITAPSPARSRFLASIPVATVFIGAVATTIINPS